MSTRLYPLYRRGNPQRRVFLPNFFMKIVKSKVDIPKNMVKFEVPLQMTQFDVKNYLEKIYKIPVAHVKTEVILGEIKPQRWKGYLVKNDDYRIATVTLHEGSFFEFPKMFKEDAMGEALDEYEEETEKLKELERKYKRVDPLRKDVPDFFGI
ncbi:39S ribosomal protein L23, mitochondrial [Galendromus occidentalis]|uniref:Large ribosomal subunit protein uL23m n=1 Tax=Galendromus occidentalis TaxID=34638 RepID=A0AAJ6QYD7_9ACAR|nr:39S ribosomal protein L23, mitochondrial [Galendromus occidentalis]